MPVQCKNQCEEYRWRRRMGEPRSVYAAGGKRCTRCEIYIRWSGLFCPCCGIRLRRGNWAGKAAARAKNGGALGRKVP